LYLGNLDARRDWGHTRDYVEMQWLMLQQEVPEDFVIATGEQHSVREFVDCAAAELGLHLDVLRVLVENYESRHHAIDSPNAIEAIKFRMEQMNLTRKDLAPLMGSRGRVSEVLSHRRSLSLPMIRRLHRVLHIPQESLVHESRGRDR